MEHLAALDVGLWAAFMTAPTKRSVYPAVRDQLGRLLTAMRRSPGSAVHQRLCELVSSNCQIAGEVLFDVNRYDDAAHYYALAASAGREAGAMDLWACALTRHAYISVYDEHFADAMPMLEAAAGIATRGDTSLSTMHWVSAVSAQALAGTGDLSGCQRALDVADDVQALGDHPHNGGWLRFDGSRLAEDRGSCYTRQRRPDLAAPILTAALGQGLSVRRRGSVLVDLATVSALNSEPVQMVTHAFAALETARQTDSGVLVRKLNGLRPHLRPYRADPHVQHLEAQLADLSIAAA